MILVGQFDSPFTRRIGVTLHHYGLAFTRDTGSIFGDAARIGRINPLIRIPALIIDNGEVLIDSVAILDHLDETVGPDRALVPDSGPVRRRILQDTALIQGTTEKVLHLFYERYFHSPGTRSTDWEARCETQIAAGLAAMEAVCGDQWFSAGRFSHADVMLTCGIGYIRLRLPEMFDDARFPRLAGLAARCEAMAAFQAAAISANETMPAKG